MYFGFASEIAGIQEKNSNLNFDVAQVPQIRDASKKVTFAHMYSIALVGQSRQIAAGVAALSALTENAAIAAVSKTTNLPPVRRDLLNATQADAYQSVFYNSAIISHTWIDPDRAASAQTFRDMIESITSGKSLQNEALSKASDELNLELNKAK